MSFMSESVRDISGPDDETTGGGGGRVGGDLSVDVQKMTSFSLRRKTIDKTSSKQKTPPSSPKLRASSDAGANKLGRKGSGIRMGGASSKGGVAGTKGGGTGRKQYSTLMENEESNEDDDDGVAENFLLSKGHMAREKRSSSTSKTTQVSVPSPSTATPTPSAQPLVPPPPSASNVVAESNFPVRFTPPNEAKFPLFDSSLDGEVFDFTVSDEHVMLPPIDSSVQGALPLADISALPPPDISSHVIEQTLSVPASYYFVFQPSPPVTRGGGGGDEEWVVSTELYHKCTEQFNSLSTVGDYVTGDKARDFFIQSKLPVAELSKIWKLSDIDKDGQLSFAEFIIAMKLVLMRRKGHDIPLILPEPLKSSALLKTTPTELESVQAPPPRRPPPPLINKSEPTTASSGATTATLIEHVMIDDKPYAKVNLATKTNRTNQEEEDSALPLDPAIGRLVSMDTGEDTTGDEDETSTLVTVGGVVPDNAPVPKPRKKKRSPQKHKMAPPTSKVAPPTELYRSKTVYNRPAPPRPPAPYQGRSPPHVTTPTTVQPTSDEHESNRSSPCTDDIVPMVTVSKVTIKDEKVVKGHGRSTSWDLTKMLREESMGVHEDLPSAEPPKLPPRKIVSPSSDDESNKNSTATPLLQRSASTGSIASVGQSNTSSTLKQSSRTPSIDSGTVLVSNVDVLPKTKSETTGHKRVAPGPPTKAKPIIPKKPLYPPSYKRVIVTPHQESETDEKGSLSMDLYKKKTKMELQRSVRQLKEENAVYARMNIELREKYNQLVEQRVKLEVKLDSFKKPDHNN